MQPPAPSAVALVSGVSVAGKIRQTRRCCDHSGGTIPVVIASLVDLVEPRGQGGQYPNARILRVVMESDPRSLVSLGFDQLRMITTKPVIAGWVEKWQHHRCGATQFKCATGEGEGTLEIAKPRARHKLPRIALRPTRQGTRRGKALGNRHALTRGVRCRLSGGPKRREVARATLQTERGMVQIEALRDRQIGLIGREQRGHDAIRALRHGFCFNIHGPGRRH